MVACRARTRFCCSGSLNAIQFTILKSASTVQCRIHAKIEKCKELKQLQEQDDPPFVKQLLEMNGQGAKLSNCQPGVTHDSPK